MNSLHQLYILAVLQCRLVSAETDSVELGTYMCVCVCIGSDDIMVGVGSLLILPLA